MTPDMWNFGAKNQSKFQIRSWKSTVCNSKNTKGYNFQCYQQVDSQGIGFNKARTDSFIFKFTLSDIMNPQISFLIVFWLVSNRNDQKQNELWLIYQLKISKMPPIPPISKFSTKPPFCHGVKITETQPSYNQA